MVKPRLSRLDGVGCMRVLRWWRRAWQLPESQGRCVSAQVTIGMSRQKAALAAAVAPSGLSVDILLENLPTAHQPPPIGRRLAGSASLGAGVAAAASGRGTPVPAIHVPRARFVYFPVVDENDRRAAYHRHLVVAEILLGRVLVARSRGLRSINSVLGGDAEARATVPSPRALFHATTLEYHRWYDADGATRSQPLTQEDLAAQLMVADGLSMEEARHRAVHYSHALPAAEQAWLLDRRHTPLHQRPLNQAEFQTLAHAIEGAYQASASTSYVERANRQIALRIAAVLGGLLDEFTASPFNVAALSQAFNEHHLAHLRQTIEASRQAESASRVLLAGPKAWFAAKAARMRAEHQMGLALSPTACVPMRLSGRPVVVVVGGKLRTFMDGWSDARGRGAHAVPRYSLIG
jgi:hypothetical protein